MPKVKRPATTSLDELQASLQQVATDDQIKKRCEEIGEIVLLAENIPLTARKMLCAGLVGSLGVPRDRRLPFQERVIGWISDALTAVVSCAKEQKEDAKGKVDHAQAEKIRLDEALSEAKERQVAKTEVIQLKKEAAKEAATVVKSAKATLAEAERLQTDGDAHLSEIEKNKGALEDCLRAFKALVGGGESEQSSVDSFLKSVESYALDTSMLSALPAAFRKTPEIRGPFDIVVLDQLEAEITKRMSAADEALANGAPAKADRAAKVEVAKAALDAAIVAEESIKTERDEAIMEQSNAESFAKEAAKAVRDFALDMKVAEKDLSSKIKDLVQLQKGPMEAFREMLDFDGTLAKAGSQYRHIGGVRYERELLGIAFEEPEITKEIAEKLFTAAMDGPGVTATEKRTLTYIMKRCKISDDARSYLTTQIGSSWFQIVDGVRYERHLLTIAEDALVPISMVTAERLWSSAMDLNQVTATEKITLEHILATKEFEQEAKEFLTQKIAKSKVLADLEA